MTEPTRAQRAEHELLIAEIEALQERKAEALRGLALERERLRAEAELAQERTEAAFRLNEEFGDLAARAKALESRVEEVRREAATWRELANQARADASLAIAEAKGLYARMATVADALGDDGLRRWARRGITHAGEGT